MMSLNKKGILHLCKKIEKNLVSTNSQKNIEANFILSLPIIAM
jgi:hypothetical protein